jgi:hypothetical protein
MKTKQNNKSGICQPKWLWRAALAGLTLAASVSMANAATIVINTFDSSAETANYGIAYGNANTFSDVPALSFSTDDANGSPSSGSLQFVEEYGQGAAQGAYAYYFATPLTGIGQITNLEFDLKVDPASALDTFGNAAYFQLAFDAQGYVYTQLFAGNVTTNFANNGWQHFSVYNGGLPLTQLGAASSLLAVILDPYDGNYTNVPGSNHTIMYIDNIKFLTSAAPPPPPTMTITKPTQGLNFVQGSISGQFDRQNIATAGTGNYTWGGVATAGNPVTYSFTINQNSGPDLNYHIYLYQSIGDTASAPDYNQTNVLIFQIQSATNGTAIATLSWKTNLPSSGTISNAFFGANTSVTNATLVGTWSLQFTSNTGGTIIAPGASYPFSLTPDISASLPNPITVNFGINPQINDPKILGEYMVVSQISVTGVDPLSATHPHTDNFLVDSSLDTNTWTVNALTPPSILFVPTNTPYSVNWTVPDTGFELQVNTNLATPASWTSPGLPQVQLFPGKRTLIASTNLPPGRAAYFHLLQRVATQLQVLLPGETNAPGTITGKTGTPTPVSLGAGGLETVTINSVDPTFHLVTVSGDNIHLTTTDGSAITPNDAPLANGTLQQTIAFGSQGTFTVTASDTTNPSTIATNMSSSVVVGP